MKDITLNYNCLFFKGAKLNFQVFPILELKDKNLESLHLISSAILSGNLQNISFYDASILSTKFAKVTFDVCNLRNTDICSVWANDCHFLETDFSNATISDSTFVKCTFNDSIFESVSLTRCQFIDCTFEQFLIDDSTFSLNTFTRCHIKNTHFTESFYYQIFENCSFVQVKMDPVLLGFNFGFSESFIQLVEKDILKETDKDFMNKGFYINAAILRINQVQNYYDEAMMACVAALGRMINDNILVKADEIEFLKNLTCYFYEHQQIAPIGLLRIWQLLNNYFVNDASNISVDKALPHIREYANMLYFKFMDFQNDLQARLDQLLKISDMDEIVELKIVYSEKPLLSLLNLLNEFSNLAHPNCPMPRLIRTEKGSFVEFHAVASIVMPYLQTLFALLGVIVPIIIYNKQNKHEKEIKKAETNTKIPRAEIEIKVTNEKVNNSPILLPNSTVISASTNAMISDVSKILNTQPLINQTGFGGYNNENIQSITIRFH